MKLDHLTQRAWRSFADARRMVTRSGSASPALSSLGNPDRSEVVSWNEATEQRHVDYRRANPVPAGRAVAVCVSMRPHLVDAVVENLARQDQAQLDVVFVANSPDFDRAKVEQAFERIPGAVIDHPPPGTSLGAALNRGLQRSDARFVAKFDDDDIYGPQYLTDQLRAHGYAGAGVVGKHSYFARIDSTGDSYLRFPGNDFRYSGTLAGGTLVIDRDSVGEQEFDDISLGEDRAFLAVCHRRGISTFATDRFNFTQVRTGSNTWSIRDDAFLTQSVRASRGDIER
jgi:cellulose synthase/poly-beta-1,6-N-acetylglucosamine synthase-like glycosyltransferase